MKENLTSCGLGIRNLLLVFLSCAALLVGCYEDSEGELGPCRGACGVGTVCDRVTSSCVPEGEAIDPVDMTPPAPDGEVNREDLEDMGPDPDDGIPPDGSSGRPELCNGEDEDGDDNVDEGLGVGSYCDPEGMELNACQYGATACGDNDEVICRVWEYYGGEGRSEEGLCLPPEGSFIDLAAHRTQQTDCPEGEGEVAEGKICLEGTIWWLDENGQRFSESVIFEGIGDCSFDEDGWLLTGVAEDGQVACRMRLVDERIRIVFRESPDVQVRLYVELLESGAEVNDAIANDQGNPQGRQVGTIVYVEDDEPSLIVARREAPEEGQYADRFIALLDNIGEGGGKFVWPATSRLLGGVGPVPRQVLLGFSLLREMDTYSIQTDEGVRDYSGPLQTNSGVLSIGGEPGANGERRYVTARVHHVAIDAVITPDMAARYKPEGR